VIVEIITFRTADDDEGPLDLERRTYASMCTKPGFIRRTTARDGTDWVVVQLWWSLEEAESAWDEGFAAQVADLAVKRYEDLGG
jgi:hypothetical protein